MCGRFALDSHVDQQIRAFMEAGGDLAAWSPAEWGKWGGSWNIKPTQQAPALFVHKGQLRLETARWSLVPPWSKELRLKFPTFNARSEGLAQKPTWRGPVKSHRAIVPANGYYEWKKTDSKKIPHFIHDEGRPLLGFAGLYSWWHDPDAAQEEGWYLTSTILTSDAVPAVVDIHDREPVILPEQMWAWWIDPETVGDQGMVDEAAAAGSAAAAGLTAYEVAPLRGDGPELVEPVG